MLYAFKHHHIKKILAAIIVLTALVSCAPKIQQVSRRHHLSFSDNTALHRFYQYGSGDVIPIVQGHRGTVEDGFPESSIASFEHVLKHGPAVFEIDPRLTKDSVVVVFHDATLQRTTNGTGKLADYNWDELKKLRLKNANGELTKYKIHTLGEVLEWARGKTALVLDKKDVPLRMIAALIRKHNAGNYVMNMVRSTEDALFYYKEDPNRMFSASIRTSDVFKQYLAAGIPKTQLFACIGTRLTDEVPSLCKLLRDHGVRSLLAVASSYDKFPDSAERAKYYRKVIEAGVTIIESDYSIQMGKAIVRDPLKSR